MNSNLPPGVTIGMIPGNRPEDLYHDQVMFGLSFDPYKQQPAVERHVMDMVLDGFEQYAPAKIVAVRINDWFQEEPNV
jgi:hypothetical protein